MDYNTLNDNELVYLCNENNEQASSIIIDKYKPIIKRLIKEYLKEYFVVGVEVSDLYQEGLIGLLFAINTFNNDKETTFYTYAVSCIRSKLISALRYQFRQKNKPLNNSYSLDNILDESNNDYYNLLKDDNSDPSGLIIKREETIEIINKLKSKLSKCEIEIFDLKLKGLSNKEIASKLNKNKKNIENAIFRINKKYKELL